MTSNQDDFKTSRVISARKVGSELRTQSHSRTYSAAGLLAASVGPAIYRSRLQSNAPTSTLNSSLAPAEAHAEKEEVIGLARLKSRIEFMQNRIRCIAVAKQRNKGKVEVLRKRADDILAVRNVAEEMNRCKVEHREKVQEETKELQERTEWVKELQKKKLEEAKEELKAEKSTITGKTKAVKRSARENRLQKEAEALAKNKQVIDLLHLKGSLAEAKGEKRLFADGPTTPRSVTAKFDGLFGSRHNGYLEHFQEYGLEDMQQQLEALLEEETQRMGELERSAMLEKQAKNDLLEIAKSQIL